MSKFLRCYRDFSGGLSEVANDNMEDNQLAQAVNIVPGEGYGICRSFGTEIALPRLEGQDSPQGLRYLVDLTVATDNTHTLAFSQDEAGCWRLYRYDSGENIWGLIQEDISPVRDWFIHGNQLYWLNGQDISCYDGSQVSSVDQPSQMSEAVWNRLKTAAAVEQRGQRWFYATTNNEVLFSQIGEPFSLEDTAVINVNTKNDDVITALHAFGSGLLIFKRYSVHYLSGWDLEGGTDVQLIQLSVTSGTRWGQTVVTMEKGVFYLGENGLYRLYVPSNIQTVAAENVSEHKISDAIFAEGELTEAFATAWDNTYFFTVRGSQPNSLRREYRYYPHLEAFFGPFTQEAVSYSLRQGQLYLGVENGYILRYQKDSRHYINPVTGGLAAIPVYAVTKGFDVANAMVQDIRLRKVVAVARQYKEEQSHFTVRVKADYRDNAYQVGLVELDESLVYGEGSFGQVYWGWADTVTKELAIKRRTKRLWFFISDEHVDEPLLIYGLGLVFKKRNAKGSRLGVQMTPVDYEE